MTPRDLILAHLPLVRAIAVTVRRTLLTCPIDDLVSFGNEGLCEAAERFDPTTGATFATFAFYRIRGAMIEGARADSGWTKSKHAGERVDLESIPEAPSDLPSPEDMADRALRLEMVRETLAAMPEAEASLVVAVEARGETLEEAGADLGLGRSWACRLRARAMRGLQARCVEGRAVERRPVRVVKRDVKPEKVVQVAAPVSVVQPRRQSVVFRGRTPYRAPFQVSRGSGSGCRGDGGTPVRPPGRGSDASAASPPTMDRRPRWERQSAGPCDLGSLIHRHERGIERAGAPPGTAAGAWAS